jgi:hypothetical protein
MGVFNSWEVIVMKEGLQGIEFNEFSVGFFECGIGVAQAFLAALDDPEVAEAAQGGGDGGVEFRGGQFGFFFVVVDVVFEDDAVFRGLAGLTGTQDDTDEVVVVFLADVSGDIEAGVFGFHDDVEQDDGDLRILSKDFLRLLGVVGTEKFETSALEDVLAEYETGDAVDFFFIVHDQ